jgi:hypothetical protein
MIDQIEPKDIMSNINLRNITNSFQDVRLGSLTTWKARAEEFIPHDPGGPYVVTQEGYDPDDATLTPDEFILRRSGEWASLSLFFQLPEPDRAEFVFRTAAEVMQVMNDLPLKVRIVPPSAREQAAPAPADVDEMAAALQKGKGGAT